MHSHSVNEVIVIDMRKIDRYLTLTTHNNVSTVYTNFLWKIVWVAWNIRDMRYTLLLMFFMKLASEKQIEL